MLDTSVVIHLVDFSGAALVTYVGYAFIVRRRTLNLRWRPNISFTKFKNLTRQYLRHAGWRVILVETVYADFDVYVGKCRCYIKCRVDGASVPITFTRDLVEFRQTAAFPVVVVFLQRPGQWLRDQFRADGVLAIWYGELNSLKDLLISSSVTALPRANVQVAEKPVSDETAVVNRFEATGPSSEMLPVCSANSVKVSFGASGNSSFQVAKPMERGMQAIEVKPKDLPNAAELNQLQSIATAAEARHDWTSACDAYQKMRDLEPDREAISVSLLRTLELDRRDERLAHFIDECRERFPQSAPILVIRARYFEKRRDWAASYLIWLELRRLDLHTIDATLGLALSLREIRKFDEADNLLVDALIKYPGDRRLLESYALIAQVRRDWQTSVSRWNALLDFEPRSLPAHVGLLLAYREANELDKATSLVRESQQAFPDALPFWVEVARIYGAARNWDAAINAWATVQLLDTKSPQGAVEAAEILSRQKKLDEAKVLLAEATKKFPMDVGIAICHARIENFAKRWRDAIVLWEPLAHNHPHNALILTGFAEALWAVKAIAELKLILDRLLVVQPHSVAGAILYARLEMRNGQPSDAVRRLSAVQEMVPNNIQIDATLNDARMYAILDVETAQSEPLVNVSKSADTINTNNPKEMLLQFESLGNGCEFGLFQRKFGAEPMGLLRWASITPLGLSRLLEQRFESIDSVHLNAIRPDGENYVLVNSKYDLAMQTYIPITSEAPATLLPKLCKRQRYLARHLMESLERSEHVFVYKTSEPIEQTLAARLQRAVLSYGENLLLIVQLADEYNKAGSLRVANNGTLLGFVDRFSNTDISLDVWLDVCTAAYEVLVHARGHLRMRSMTAVYNAVNVV